MGKMRPQFPSYTFPNHFSMVTGVHPEVHGIVNNRFFDRRLNATFSYNSDTQKDPKWWNYEPVSRPVTSYLNYLFLFFRYGIRFRTSKMV